MPIDNTCLPIEEQADLDAVSEAIWELVNSEPDDAPV